MPQPDLTIAIPVRNEEGKLSVCLQAIGSNFATKVVVIDSDSTDATTEVTIRHGAEMINFNWKGHFHKKRNWYLRDHTLTIPRMLFVDADKFLSLR